MKLSIHKIEKLILETLNQNLSNLRAILDSDIDYVSMTGQGFEDGPYVDLWQPNAIKIYELVLSDPSELALDYLSQKVPSAWDNETEDDEDPWALPEYDENFDMNDHALEEIVMNARWLWDLLYKTHIQDTDKGERYMMQKFINRADEPYRSFVEEIWNKKSEGKGF